MGDDEKVKNEALQIIGQHQNLPTLVVSNYIAKSFLQTLGIHSLFVTQEIFSSWTHKTEHIQRIHATTGVPFSSMLFFDDEDRNIQTVSKMGVTSILVGNGVNLGALRQGLLEFSRKSASSSRR
ncbi:hypothetical protein L3X38_033922 [Prunus dulcis]|uniref:Haloacid dehalogenase-like hydrolase superfamily protein n=1 Tax=Prunus dulcis TaxID=3755 RepID=A0AAD4YXE0_PRUDU|nr:hypothetical protein L3X38_033922 [Prunus dulcis]